VPKLQKVVLNYEAKDNQIFESLVNRWQNTLKSLEIITNESSISLLSQLIKRLKLLEELNLDLETIVENQSLFAYNLQSIAGQCNQINQLQLTFGCTNQILDSQLLRTMAYFKNLKYLAFDVYSEQVDGQLANNQEVLSKSLKDCVNLVHFKLDNVGLNDQFFKDIHLYLPKLKHLEIGVHTITDQALHSLAQLNQLQFIAIDSDEDDLFYHVTDIGICYIINNCPQINSINFNSRPNITNKTIEELIKLALSKPKVQFEHYFSFIGHEDDVSENDVPFTTIDLNDFGDLPKNLVIDY